MTVFQSRACGVGGEAGTDVVPVRRESWAGAVRRGAGTRPSPRPGPTAARPPRRSAPGSPPARTTPRPVDDQGRHAVAAQRQHPLVVGPHVVMGGLVGEGRVDGRRIEIGRLQGRGRARRECAPCGPPRAGPDRRRRRSGRRRRCRPGPAPQQAPRPAAATSRRTRAAPTGASCRLRRLISSREKNRQVTVTISLRRRRSGSICWSDTPTGTSHRSKSRRSVIVTTCRSTGAGASR